MDTSEVIARFESERQALALMDHPNIARVIDAGATGSGHPTAGLSAGIDGAMHLVAKILGKEVAQAGRIRARVRMGGGAEVIRRRSDELPPTSEMGREAGGSSHRIL